MRREGSSGFMFLLIKNPAKYSCSWLVVESSASWCVAVESRLDSSLAESRVLDFCDVDSNELDFDVSDSSELDSSVVDSRLPNLSALNLCQCSILNPAPSPASPRMLRSFSALRLESRIWAAVWWGFWCGLV